jgi:hypothetical protein
MPEPGGLDHAAAQWCWHLLVLAGEIVLADRAADLLEHRQDSRTGCSGSPCRRAKMRGPAKVSMTRH